MAGSTVSAFTDLEYRRVYTLLASKVATMRGRKMEEDDWSSVYLQAKQIPKSGWSNTDLDINHEGLGVESKLKKSTRQDGVLSYCGSTVMHPAGTRAVEPPPKGFGNGDADEAAQFMINEYSNYIRRRTEEVKEKSSDNQADLRLSLLMWEDDLSEFIYFERDWNSDLDPDNYYGEWRHHDRSGNSSRQSSTNLWIYRKSDDEKVYSVTQRGIKVQPYIEVPEEDNNHLYHFVTQGETTENLERRIWTPPTLHIYLKEKLGSDVDGDDISEKIHAFAEDIASGDTEYDPDNGIESIPIANHFDISQGAYSILQELDAASDTDALRIVLRYLE